MSHMFRNTASSTLEHLRVSLYGPAFSLSLWPTDVFLLCLCLFRLNPVEQGLTPDCHGSVAGG